MSYAKATSSNTALTQVLRDASGNFSAGTITATLNGNASTVTNGVYTTGSYSDPAWIISLAGSKISGAVAQSDGIGTSTITTNASFYPLFVTNNGTFYQTVGVNGSLNYNPSTGTLSATTFSGSFSGTVTNATNIGITDDTTTNATMYPLWVTTTSGNLPAKVSSTKITFNPSTGIFSTVGLNLSGLSASQAVVTDGSKNLASLAYTNANTASTLVQRDGSGNFSAGTISPVNITLSAAGGYLTGATGDYIRIGDNADPTKQFVFDPSGNATTKHGTFVSSLTSGRVWTMPDATGTVALTTSTVTTATNAVNTAITDDTTTNATMYPTWVTSNTGNLPQKVTSTKLSFNPSTGVLTSTSFTGAGTGLTGTASSLTAGTVTTNANLTGPVTSSGNATTVVGMINATTVISGTSQSAVVDNAYYSNNAGLVTITLPSTAAVGSVIEVGGLGAGGWRIAQNVSQLIHLGSSVTTTGTGGRLDSTNQYDSVTLRCVVANTTWNVISVIGNITVT